MILHQLGLIPLPPHVRPGGFDHAAVHVNIIAPQIVIIAGSDPTHIERTFEIPVAGPHGLDLDTARGRLFCACDGGTLVTLDRLEGQLLDQQPLAEVPDVILFNHARQHLCVAIGDPGVLQVFDTQTEQLLETVATEQGAQTLGFDAGRNKVYAFLPQRRQALRRGGDDCAQERRAALS